MTLQAERLSDFYEVCKGLDLARSFQFPTLEQVCRIVMGSALDEFLEVVVSAKKMNSE